jgi:hypothetical protein
MEKRYKYFLINDPSKETIGLFTATTIDLAWYNLSLIKKLDIKDLRKLYVIVELI